MLHALPLAGLMATVSHTLLIAHSVVRARLLAVMRVFQKKNFTHSHVVMSSHPSAACFAAPLALVPAERVDASASAAQDFNKVIYASFAAMAVVYGLVAGLGYYYFGDAASTLVTNDLATNSPYTGRWVRSQVVDKKQWRPCR